MPACFMDLSLQACLEYVRFVEGNKGAYVLHYYVRYHKLKQGTYAGKLLGNISSMNGPYTYNVLGIIKNFASTLCL